MTNDAKLGMIIGVGLVVAIAAVFFRRDGLSGPAAAQQTAATAVPSPNSPYPTYGGASRTVPARTAIRVERTTFQGQRHVVGEGETLFSLARQYYQDERKFVDIYNLNRSVLPSPDHLAPGTVLIIPRMP